MGAGSEAYDAKWSRFLPSQCFNVEKSLMPVVADSKKQEIIKAADKHQKTCVNHPASGLEKRQCTLQVWYGGLYAPHKIFSLFYKREELRKYFSMITHAMSFFRDSTSYLSFFHDNTCNLSFCRDAIRYLSLFPR